MHRCCLLPVNPFCFQTSRRNHFPWTTELFKLYQWDLPKPIRLLWYFLHIVWCVVNASPQFRAKRLTCTPRSIIKMKSQKQHSVQLKSKSAREFCFQEGFFLSTCHAKWCLYSCCVSTSEKYTFWKTKWYLFKMEMYRRGHCRGKPKKTCGDLPWILNKMCSWAQGVRRTCSSYTWLGSAQALKGIQC